MSGLQFVASLVRGLASTLVALVAVIDFRWRLLAREHLKAFSVEAQFGQQLAHVKPWSKLRLPRQEMATASLVSTFRSWSRR